MIFKLFLVIWKVQPLSNIERCDQTATCHFCGCSNGQTLGLSSPWSHGYRKAPPSYFCWLKYPRYFTDTPTVGPGIPSHVSTYIIYQLNNHVNSIHTYIHTYIQTDRHTYIHKYIYMCIYIYIYCWWNQLNPYFPRCLIVKSHRFFRPPNVARGRHPRLVSDAPILHCSGAGAISGSEFCSGSSRKEI